MLDVSRMCTNSVHIDECTRVPIKRKNELITSNHTPTDNSQRERKQRDLLNTNLNLKLR